MARLLPLETPAETKPLRRYGFMEGECELAGHFDIKAFGREEIEEMFFGDPDKFGDSETAS